MFFAVDHELLNAVLKGLRAESEMLKAKVECTVRNEGLFKEQCEIFIQQEAAANDDIVQCQAELQQARSAMQAMVPCGVHDTVAEDLSLARDEVERLKRSMAGTVSSSEMSKAALAMEELK